MASGSGRVRSGWPLPVYFAALAAMVVVVATAAGAYVYIQSAGDAQQFAVADANFAARKAADQLTSSLDFIEKTSQPIATNPTTRALLTDPSKCTLGYVPVGVFDTGHIDIVRSDGSVACSSRLPAPTGKVYAGQSWLQAGAPMTVAPTTDPVTGTKVAVVSYPIGLDGALAWFLDLAPLGPKLEKQFGSGVHQLEFLVASADGKTIIARSIDSQRWTGSTLTGTPFAGSQNAVDRPDVGGTPRWYGQAIASTTGWTVYAGADKAAALAATGTLQLRQRSIILVGLLAVLLAMLVIYRRVARPITALSRAVRASRGLETLAMVPAEGPAEVAGLGADINNLITSLQHELTERASAQQTYLRLFESSPLPMVVMDPKTGMYLDLNEAAVKAFGYSRDEFKKMSGRDLYVPRDEAEQKEIDSVRSRAGKTYVKYGPISFRKKNESIQRAIVTSYQVEYSGGQPVWVAMIEDVTEKERLERQHEQTERLESLGQLAGGVAHDFNNLLAVILNVVAQLRAQLQASADRAEGNWTDALRDLARVDKAAQSAARLTRQLLAFARREVVQKSVIDLSEQIGALTELLRRTLGSHILLTVTLPDDLWPVLMDPGHLEQVVINLSVNARDAMERGGTLLINTANVTVDEAEALARPGLIPGRYVRLEVVDSGLGMDRSTLEHAFEPFFTTKAPGRGTGLGLATVYGIVKQVEGHVSIDSEVGLGTTVTVLIPATDHAAPAKTPAPEVPRERGSATVLVVEDYGDLRELIEEILKGAGYRVLSAPDGAVALTLARQHPGEIDLLLTDIVMPNMLGPDLAAQMRKESPGLRVLFMSGHAQPVLDSTNAIEPGTVLLQKPFMEGELLGKLREVLASPPSPASPL